jgi:predicted O-methyltransferase YrrM
VRQREQVIFDALPRTLPGIDLNPEGQLQLLDRLKEYYHAQPFQDHKQPHLRYFFENPNYSYGEAIVLFCLINLVKPKRIVEVGSGYSSCVILDTNEQVFQRSINCAFVEPYPELLESLLKKEDRSSVRILPHKVQDVDLELFTALGSGDILFIDSSHVS